MNMSNVFTGGWIASLSNGETVYETEPVDGQPTPWQALVSRTKTDKHTVKRSDGELSLIEEVPLTITMLRLQYGPTMIQAMPHQMCDGYFQAREVQQIVYRQEIVHMQGIGSIVGSNVFITWLQFTPQGQFYIKTEVRPLETCKVHTTMQ